ncbi:hypothetical protein DIPPA_25656 [Diplonema papillatum]|nr:hypothetical protein DIPPA_23459 [Diplonema papillatum]KAJ9463030.1 hypothetical protein DIPPA_25656 [Diplonema papillatum]
MAVHNEDVELDVASQDDTVGSGSSGPHRLHPFMRRLRTDEAALILRDMEVLRGLGVKGDETTLCDTIDALKKKIEDESTPVTQPTRVRSPPPIPSTTIPMTEDFNKKLELAAAKHYNAWLANVRNKAGRAIDWVMECMLEDASKGKVALAYDIPPGQEDFLHETYPEWLTEERGSEVLRSVVHDELRKRGFRVPTDALEKRTHGENHDRHYFRLSHSVDAPSDVLSVSSPARSRTVSPT